MTEFKQQIKDLTLVPAGGGVFEVSVDDELIYSKAKTGQFPNEQWVLDAIRQRLKQPATTA